MLFIFSINFFDSHLYLVCIPRSTAKDVSFTQKTKGFIMRISIISFFLFSFFFIGCGNFGNSVEGVEGVEGGGEETVKEICGAVRSAWDAHSYGVEVNLAELWEEWEENNCEEKECEQKVEKKKQKKLEDCYHISCIDLVHFNAAREKEACWEE